MCKATKTHKDIGGCRLVYRMESHKILQEGWWPPTPTLLYKTFAPWTLWKHHKHFGQKWTQHCLLFGDLLTPKGWNVYTTNKPVLGSITWSPFIFRFFETFCENAPCNKLHGSTNFIIFGPTDQKLWVFENFRRSPGRAGMCWSQPVGVDHMCKNMWAWGRKFFL
jgi:hypothetical protein